MFFHILRRATKSTPKTHENDTQAKFSSEGVGTKSCLSYTFNQVLEDNHQNGLQNGSTQLTVQKINVILGVEQQKLHNDGIILPKTVQKLPHCCKFEFSKPRLQSPHSRHTFSFMHVPRGSNQFLDASRTYNEYKTGCLACLVSAITVVPGLGFTRVQ